MIKASSGHEPALFLCYRHKEANRTPEFCHAYSDDPQTYAIKRRPRNMCVGTFPELTSVKR